MKHVYNFLVFVLVICCLSVSGCQFLNSANVDNSQKSVALSQKIDVVSGLSQQQLIKKVSPAVVGISAVSGREQSIGSGVCVSEKSYILTNNHVVENGNVISLYLADGSSCGASLVWRDASCDLAILKANKSVPYLSMAESGTYGAGDEVIALGTPLALAFKHSATKGIISATNRTVQVDNTSGESTLSNLIQHDASINPGNSGGPLINLKGEILGINTVKITDAEGMGFAIPVDTIHPLVSKLNANGYYDTAYMGVFGYDASLNQIYGGQIGYYVQSVAENSPASDIGIKKGDTILKLNGTQIDGAMSLRKLLYGLDSGDKVNIEYTSNGVLVTKSVTLKKHPCCYKSQLIPMYD